MIQEVNITVLPETAQDEALLKKQVANHLQIPVQEINHIRFVKRSIDARSKKVKIVLRLQVFTGEDQYQAQPFDLHFPTIDPNKKVIVVGAGPAGLFAAIKLLEQGITPIVLERGKDVRERRKDLAAINKEHIVNPDSNYCFGEGGAGTYSDGKLYTRSTKRGDVQSILQKLVYYGASEDILVDAHPHIGTNKLPQIIVSMREAILAAGGEVHFKERVSDFILQENQLKGVVTTNTESGESKEFIAKHVLLATGHSARDIFDLLVQKNILIEAKPFALGVRVEHPQSLIDRIQYHCDDRGPYLPPASYSLVHQVNDKGVYSFCMCPGGIIAPCATSPGEIVTNGWSPSKRNNPFANSGIVVEVDQQLLKQYEDQGALAGVAFQKSIEQAAFVAGGETQTAPAQALEDFVQGKLSSTLAPSSYQPGTKSVALHELLPEPIASGLREAFKVFGKKMKGYLTNEAVVHAVESRTSSPVKIPRDRESREHPQIKGLFPCGEGAGYAGGIVSAAIDGEACAMAIANQMNP